MFAANRKERVIGRTAVLRVSTSVRKGFNQAGAPAGRSAAKKDVGANVKEEIIKANHNGKPKVKVNKRCLVTLNI